MDLSNIVTYLSIVGDNTNDGKGLENESRKLSKKQARFSRRVERWQSKANPFDEKIARGKEDLANIQNSLTQTLETLDSYRAKLSDLLK